MIMDCSICLVNQPREAILVHNVWKDTQQPVMNILMLHFKWLNEPLSVNSIICSSCWHRVYEFHTFYDTVWKLQNVRLFPEKTEPISITDAEDEPGPPEQLPDPIQIKRETADNELPDTLGGTSDSQSTETTMLPTKRKYVHTKSAENNETAFWFRMKCDLCKATFSNFREANRHYKQEHQLDNGYLVCCDRQFTSAVSVRDHCAWHRDPSVFDCSICLKTFKKRASLQQHHTVVHKSSKEELPFECLVCQKSFASQHKLGRHQQLVHTEYGDKKYECYICKRRYVYLTMLKTHLNATHTTDPSHVCDVCAKTFKSKTSYEYHYHAAHSTGNQQVQCEECGKWLKHKHTLYRHMRLHKNIEQTCTECGHVAAGSQALYVHVRRMHQEPKYKCLVCEKIFRKSSNLREHMAVHQNIHDLYKCGMCAFACRSSGNMSKHRKRVHGTEQSTR